MAKKFLSPEEAQRMARAGLDKMRKESNPMLVQMDQLGDTEHEGPKFNKKQMRLYNALCEVAVVELANEQFDPWQTALGAIKELMLGVGFPRENVIATWNIIEGAACELAQEPRLGEVARTWVRNQRSRTISIPRNLN